MQTILNKKKCVPVFCRLGARYSKKVHKYTKNIYIYAKKVTSIILI